MKKALVSLLSVALAFSAVTPIVSAEDGGSAKSNATVQFEAPKEVDIKPLDPTDPTKENGNVEGVPGENRGALSLDFVSHLDFGNHEITNEEAIIPSETDKPYIQVTDLRGTGEGWHVTANASTFNTKDESGEIIEENTLPAATITLSNGEAKSPSPYSPGNLDVENSISLVAGNEASSTVVSAKGRETGKPINTAEGLGTWLISWLNNSDEGPDNKVTLTVPAGSASKGTHTATITWTLSSGPGTTVATGE